MRGRADHALVLVAWLVMLPLMNPLGLGHNGVLLALPIVFLAGAAAAGGHRGHGWAWCVAVILISVPKQTIWRFAPPPSAPFEGLAIAGLPMWGTLLLFLIALSLSMRVRAGEPTLPSLASGKLMSPQQITRVNLLALSRAIG